MTNKILTIIAILLTNILISSHALDTQQDNIQTFISRVSTNHGLDKSDIEDLLAKAEIKESILKAISRPAEKSKPWYEYRKIFVNPKRINQGVEFWKNHREAIERVALQRGVPPEIIVAIIGVETNYGRLSGRYRVLDALSTLAFEYPPRSEFFTSELENFILLTREEDIDPLSAKGSYAGAMGAPQFMPSSYRVYSSDGDGDGQRNLFNNWEDVFASVANYFIDHGWQPGQSVVSRAQANPSVAKLLELKTIVPAYRVGFLHDQGIEFSTDVEEDALSMIVNLEDQQGIQTWVGFQNYYVITRYNRSKMYAMAVYQLSQEILSRVYSDE